MKRIIWLSVLVVFCLWSFSAGSAQAQNFPGKWLTSTLGQLAPLLEGREGACADFSSALVGTVNQDRIYLTHGYRGFDTANVRAYDINTNTWIALVPIVGPGVPAKSEGAGVEHGGLIYCVGGRIGGATTNVTVYDPTSNTLNNVAPLGTPRAGVAVARWGKYIYAFGGRLAGGGPCTDPGPLPPIANTAERYDVTLNTWSPVTGPPLGVSDASATSQGGKIYVVGGCTGPVSTNFLQVYDPVTDAWSPGPAMPSFRASLGTGVIGNTLYAIGGITGAFGINLPTVEAFDIAKGTWSGPLTPKPTASSEVQAVEHGGKLYLPGSGPYGLAGSIFEAFQRK